MKYVYPEKKFKGKIHKTQLPNLLQKTKKNSNNFSSREITYSYGLVYNNIHTVISAANTSHIELAFYDI